MGSGAKIRKQKASAGDIPARIQSWLEIYMPDLQCPDVLRMAPFVRGHRRSALFKRRSQNERDAQAVDRIEGASRSCGRSRRIVSNLGSVPANAVDQLGRQISSRCLAAGAASDAPG